MAGNVGAHGGRRQARGLALALSVALLTACGQEPGGEEGSAATASSRSRAAVDTAREAVLAELGSYYRDFSARDWEAFVDHFWPDATLTTIWQPEGEPRPRVTVQTAAEFAEAGPEGPGSREIFEEEMTSHRAEVDGAAGVATVWAGYRARFGDPGDVMEWSGTDVFTLLRHDGRWRIASLVFVPEGGEGPETEGETGAAPAASPEAGAPPDGVATP